MSKILVIVESVGKIKKMQQILGSKYIVTASLGHIIDLAPGKLSIDIDNGFNPIYAPIERSIKVIKDIKKLLKKSSDVILATDKDREGEAIAWSLAYILQLKNPKRILFTDITKKTIAEAISNITSINQNMVDAQKTRRILDRLVGFKISPILRQCINGDSAGRVQSIVVKLIVDKEENINAFINSNNASYFKCKGNFRLPSNVEISSNLCEITKDNKIMDTKFTKNEAQDFFSCCMNSDFKISNTEITQSSSNPSPPYETSTMQQEASSYLKFSSKRTMTIAQHLYEEGYITYMRTDSVNLSEEALIDINKYIMATFGTKYYSKREYKTKSKNAQEAHEAIRPTDIYMIPDKLEIGGKIDEDEIKLYKLIWNRTIASQMSAALYDVCNINISISESDKYLFTTSIRKLIFDGYLKIYSAIEDDNSVLFDTLKNSKNKYLKVKNIISNEEYQKPKARFSEASLLKTLKKLEIGRPATTANIISKIQERKYVAVANIDGIKKNVLTMNWDGESDQVFESNKEILYGQEKTKYIPTTLGKLTTDFLNKNFTELMEYQFTTDMEKKLDKIEKGKLKWNDELHRFYGKLSPLLEQLEKNMPKRSDNRPSRLLGTHPDTGCDIIATIAKYGDVVKYCISEKSPLYASIDPPLSMDNINLEQAIQLFNFPKVLGQYKGDNIIIKKGMYGYYITHDNKNYQLNDHNEHINLEQAIEIIISKYKNIIKDFKEGVFSYTLIDGQYGLYLSVYNSKTKKYKNIPFPKKIDINLVDLDYVKLIIETQKDYKKNKKTPIKKTNETLTKKTTPIKKTNETLTKKTPKKIVKQRNNTSTKKINNKQNTAKKDDGYAFLD
jgi:DNA topoisomerase I